MLVEKYIDPEKGACIILKEEKKGSLQIHYHDGSLYWTLHNYTPDNGFYIMKENELYEPMMNLFRNIKACDSLHFMYPNKNGNIFEWISDSYGIPGFQNRLIISQKHDRFRIHFVKGRCNSLNDNNKCSVSFSLYDSNNKNIANAFDNMFAESFTNLLPAKKKQLLAMK